MNKQVLKSSKLRKSFWGGGIHPHPPNPPLYVWGVIEPKRRLHQWIHTQNTQKYIGNQSSLLTLLIKRQNMTIFIVCRTQCSTSHTTSQRLLVTQYRLASEMGGGGGSRPLKSMISRQITQKHIKRKSTLFSLLIKRYQKSLFIVRRPQYQFIAHTWRKLMIELRYRLSEISQENLGISRELLRNIPENFREILSRFWDFFGNRNGLRILGNSWEWNGVLLDPGNSRRFPGTGASIFKGRYYRNV